MPDFGAADKLADHFSGISGEIEGPRAALIFQRRPRQGS